MCYNRYRQEHTFYYRMKTTNRKGTTMSNNNTKPQENYPYFRQNMLYLCGNELTHEELARILGVSRTAVTGYFNGNIPNKKILMAISNYFHIPVECLLKENLSQEAKRSKEAFEEAEQNLTNSGEDILDIVPLFDMDKELLYKGKCQLNKFTTSVTLQDKYFHLENTLRFFFAAGNQISSGYANWISVFLVGLSFIDEASSKSKSIIKKDDYLQQHISQLDYCMEGIKKDARFSDLTHYFLAQLLIFGLAKGVRSMDKAVTKVSGMTMMRALADMGNPYAANYIKICDPIFSHYLDELR